MSTDTMSAAVVETPGGAFQLRELARPRPAAGHVLVRVHASGLNPLDAKIRAGAAAHARQPLPAVLGLDVAGTVEELGANVTDFRVGDEVYGMTGGVGGLQGSLAEYQSVDARLLARKPSTLSMQEAAALPLIFITAWEGLVDRAHVAPGQRVLIQGAAGGVGHVAVQIAKAMGAEVFGVDRGGKADFLASLGATPIDFETTSVADYVALHTQGKGFDLVYDTGGGAVLDASFAAVRHFGHVVSCLGWGSHALAPLSFKAGTYSGVFTLHALISGEGRAHLGEIMREATALAERGQLRPNVDPRVFTLQEVEDAHAAMADRSAKGKLAVSVVA